MAPNSQTKEHRERHAKDTGKDTNATIGKEDLSRVAGHVGNVPETDRLIVRCAEELTVGDGVP